MVHVHYADAQFVDKLVIYHNIFPPIVPQFSDFYNIAHYTSSYLKLLKLLPPRIRYPTLFNCSISDLVIALFGSYYLIEPN